MNNVTPINERYAYVDKHLLDDFDQNIQKAIQDAGDLPKGLIVAILQAHLYRQTRRMCGQDNSSNNIDES